MSTSDDDRIVFQSKHDLSCGYYLSKAEKILNHKTNEDTDNINDILEFYNIKLFFDNNLYFDRWSDLDIASYQDKINGFGIIIGKFIASINDKNFKKFHSSLSFNYVKSFWALLNNHKQYKHISATLISKVLEQNPYQITEVLKHKRLVDYYQVEICEFLKTYEKSAEIILYIYEVEDRFENVQMYLPESLSLLDKESIVSSYISSESCNFNYLPIIQNAKKLKDFNISDKVRLQAKRKYQQHQDEFFNSDTNNFLKFGVQVSFKKDAKILKRCSFKDNIVHYEYRLDHIQDNNDPYTLFENFKRLFDYIDEHSIVTLTSKENKLTVLERTLGVRSKNEYLTGFLFKQQEMTSLCQIHAYSKILIGIEYSVEKIIDNVVNFYLPNLYEAFRNAKIFMPIESASALEKVRIIAPEFESILKQFKLLVDNGEIEFELLQMSSGPTAIRDIPSLCSNKYVYLKTENNDVKQIIYLMFSNQTESPPFN